MASYEATTPGKYFSVDVECVASGRRHDDRSVALIALVDQRENVVLRKTVKQRSAVFSYLTPLTGLKKGDLDNGVQLEDAIRDVKAFLGPDAILVGQSIESDIKWLDLKRGIDYKSFIDLVDVFKTYNPRWQNYYMYSLSHVANTLLQSGFITEPHDPALDAIASIRLFNRYYNNAAMLAQAKQALKRSRPPQSWVKRQDYQWEGVCMAGCKPSKCICGAPTMKRD